MKPWERYQQPAAEAPAKPWEKFAQPEVAPEPAPVAEEPGFTDYAAQLARGVGEGVETLGRMVEL